MAGVDIQLHRQSVGLHIHADRDTNSVGVPCQLGDVRKLFCYQLKKSSAGFKAPPVHLAPISAGIAVEIEAADPADLADTSVAAFAVRFPFTGKRRPHRQTVGAGNHIIGIV